MINLTPPQGSPRKIFQQKYNTARGNLLIVAVFTVLNMGMAIVQNFSYFMFSAFIPYFTTYTGMVLSGMLPDEFYTGEYEDAAIFGKEAFYIALAVAVVILMLYVVCWLFSKDNGFGWMTFALVLFGIDSLALIAFNGFSSVMIFDILFHIWVMFYLVNGVIAAKKLKNLPLEQEDTEVQTEEQEGRGYDE